MKCICGNALSYELCCEKFILGLEKPSTALALMRSRYSAYVLGEGQYLYDTCSSHLQKPEDILGIKEQKIEWLALKIHNYTSNEVTFSAYYRENRKIEVMKEHSFFVQNSGWKYDKGELLNTSIQRNESCPCGSGKKYKRCCDI